MTHEEFSELLRREEEKRNRMWDPAALANDRGSYRLGRRPKARAAQLEGRLPGGTTKMD